ncbi:hypothetical protein SLA2020_232530 [Shorea laevis]
MRLKPRRLSCTPRLLEKSRNVDDSERNFESRRLNFSFFSGESVHLSFLARFSSTLDAWDFTVIQFRTPRSLLI